MRGAKRLERKARLRNCGVGSGSRAFAEGRLNFVKIMYLRFILNKLHEHATC